MTDSGLLRIGELSRRSGVSRELLRAWEHRYGLLQPSRSAGGMRLYTEGDLRRIHAMQQHMAGGLAAAEAAALAVREPAPNVGTPPADAHAELRAALSGFDDARAHAVVDALLSETTVDTLLGRVVIPYLHELGARWEKGEASVAEEHFATNLLRGRLLGLARGWGIGVGPRALLACAPGEQHDLGLIAFGLALRARGWRVLYLGADTPLASLATAADAWDPQAVVVSSVSARRLRGSARQLQDISQAHPLWLGGAGASGAANHLPARLLPGDPVAEAQRLVQLGPAAGRRG